MAENLFTKLLRWLRAGYPEGVPQQDYLALLGVLHRHLTEEEVERLAFELRDGEGGIDGATTDERIREAIGRATLEEADEQDVRRVHARLAAGGWPLADVTDPDRS